MNRIERNGATYPAWLDSDERVIELFRGAERKRKQVRDRWLGWTGAAIVSLGLWWLIIYGAARAIDMARSY